MNVFVHLSDLAIPLILFLIVGFGLASGVKVYESFLKGAGDGLKLVLEIVPTLIGLMTATSVLYSAIEKFSRRKHRVYGLPIVPG